MKFLLSILFVLGCQTLTIHTENCTLENKSSGYIQHYLNERTGEVCWVIEVPRESFIKVDVKQLSFESEGQNGLEITEIQTGLRHIFDAAIQTQKLFFKSDIKITHYARNQAYKWWSSFTLFYKIAEEWTLFENDSTTPQITHESTTYEIDQTPTPKETIRSKNCTLEKWSSGHIEHYLNAIEREVCWIIKVPRKSFITVDVKQLSFESVRYNGLEITEIKTGRKYVFNAEYQTRKVVFRSDIQITHYARNGRYSSVRWWSSFTLFYRIERGYLPIRVGGDSLEWGIAWLRDQSSDTMGWKENTPRAVVALYLASAVNFNGTVFEEELMANQVELKTAVALLKSTSTINELSMLLNALVVTCYNPRKFHGMDVVKQLKTLVEESKGVTHPVAYLSLCNANETWPRKAFDDLEGILNTTSDFQVNIDMKAMAVMALRCYLNHLEDNRLSNKYHDIFLYQDTIEHFKMLQLEDGSFGNIYTTSLIAQALISEGDEDWNANATADYLIRKLNTSVNFLTAYLTLPVLNGKSLVDVSFTNCSAHPRRHGDDIDDIDEDLGPKMQVKYSLYIGDNKNVIHTMFLMVPHGYTAYQVMELAEIQNPKYKFERKNIFGKINVFEIADLPNDPESGKYWLMYVDSPNKTDSAMHPTQSPNEWIMKNGQHLIMWYRSHYL